MPRPTTRLRAISGNPPIAFAPLTEKHILDGKDKLARAGLGDWKLRHWNYLASIALLAMATSIEALIEKSIDRIRETCEMMGSEEKFQRTLAELEIHLKEEVAAGETSETRLTFDGLCFLHQVFSQLR